MAISNDGRYVVVSAKDGMNEEGVDVGAVYIYSMDRELSPPEEEEGLTLLQVLYGESSKDEYGNALALSHDGKRLVVGSRSENNQMGAIRIYQLDDNDGTSLTWTLMDGGVIKGEYPSERAGWSVSISPDGNVVAIGAPKGGSTEGGSVRTYKYNDGGSDDTATGSWEPYGSVIEGLPSEEAAGYSVALHDTGSIMTVGFPKATKEDGSSNTGKTAVYAMNNETNWEILGQEIFGEEENNIDGGSVAMSQDGTIIVIGGKGKSLVDKTTGDILSSVGQCRIYEYQTNPESTWALKHSIVGQVSDERLGTWVSVSPDGNVIGCGGVSGMYSTNDGSSSSTSGVVRIYNRSTLQESTIWPRGGGEGNVDKATFGSSMAISNDGEYIVVGAPTWSSTNTENDTDVGGTGGAFAGAVQVFELRHEDEIAVLDKEEEEASTPVVIGVVDEMEVGENTLDAFANDRSIL